MANHPSAKKRARQAKKRRARNQVHRSRARSSVKAARAAIAEESPDASDRVRRAESLLRRAASKGVVPRKRASRLVSRLARAAPR